MPTIHNSTTIQNIREAAAIQGGQESLPNQLASQVVPVMECNPALLRRTTFCLGQAGTVNKNAATLKTTSTTKRTFITSVALAYSKNVLCDTATGSWSLTVTPKGQSSQVIAATPKKTLFDDQLSIFVDIPAMELEPNTAILLSSFNFTAGAAAWTYSVFGYEIDNMGA